MLKPVARAIAPTLGPVMARILARSWRCEVVNQERWLAASTGGRPYVLLCWHEALLPVIWHHRHRRIATLISEARDGEYLAGFVRSLGYGIIRGSSSRGASRALRGAIRSLEEGTPIGLTPDGPRGPARVFKPGAIAAAQRTGAPILAVHAEATLQWRAGSWDRMVVPAPFARVRLAYGRPILVAKGAAARASAIELATRELEEAARLAAWRDDAVTPTA